MAANVRGPLGQLGAFVRNAIRKPTKTRPLGQFAVGTAKVAHLLESATTGVRGPLAGPRSQDVARLKRPIVASAVQAGSTAASAKEGSWTEAVDKASKVAGTDPKTRVLADPRELVGSELSFITDNLARLLESGHPMLNTVSRYYFAASGKHIRPLLVMLVAQATSTATKRHGRTSMLIDSADVNGIDYSLMDRTASQSIQSDLESHHVNQLMQNATSAAHGGRPYAPHVKDGMTILPTHRRLAEITEMIHTSSLLHDDVIDHAETRRGLPAIQK
ncbi:coq1 putative hexaprenyl diphosphate synthase, partial [Coemansia erecta]